MKFTLTINSDSPAEIVAAITALAMIDINAAAASSEIKDLTEENLAPSPMTGEKPVKPRAQKKPKFEDPGDKDPFAGAASSSTTGTDPFGDSAPPSIFEKKMQENAVETDDFGDPIKPAASTPKLTLDMLRAEMQAKSTVSAEMKEKCKALVKSYNVDALGMISEDKYPEVFEKIKAL